MLGNKRIFRIAHWFCQKHGQNFITALQTNGPEISESDNCNLNYNLDQDDIFSSTWSLMKHFTSYSVHKT